MKKTTTIVKIQLKNPHLDLVFVFWAIQGPLVFFKGLIYLII